MNWNSDNFTARRKTYFEDRLLPTVRRLLQDTSWSEKPKIEAFCEELNMAFHQDEPACAPYEEHAVGGGDPILSMELTKGGNDKFRACHQRDARLHHTESNVARAPFPWHLVKKVTADPSRL